MKPVERRGLEPEPFIEALGILVFGMDEHRTKAGDLRRVQRPQECVFEEALSDALPLACAVHRKSRQNHDWDGMLGKPFSNSLRSQAVLNASVGKRIVCHDPSCLDCHIGASRAGTLIHPGKSSEVLIQGIAATIEIVAVLIMCQGDRRTNRPGFSHRRLPVR